MMLSAYLRRARGLPRRAVVRKAFYFVVRYGARQLKICLDSLFCTYARDRPARSMRARVSLRAEDIPAELVATLRTISIHYRNHRFDLLGSGWRAPTYGFCAGEFLGWRYDADSPKEPDHGGGGLEAIVSSSNLSRARACWALIDNEGYRPIDWQLDSRSGYRWSSRRHSYRLRIPIDIGADIKMPWELGRLQHMPQLALCVVLAESGSPGFESADRYVQEITDQLLDFIATNPPRFGVNWMSAMDVAIRAANITLTLALLAGASRNFSPSVEAVVMASLVDHARYVVTHLDYSEFGRSNHYLCEIAGVLWASWVIEGGVEQERWLSFAIIEIEKEAQVQFLSDGGNYEGSTNYHRLSAEAVLFSIGIMRAIGRSVPSAVTDMLYKAADLTRTVQGTDGTIVQIGDTDSGRFFKIHPVPLPTTLRGSAAPFVENTLDHVGFVQGVEALFGKIERGTRLDAVLVRQLVDESLEPPVGSNISDFGDLEGLERKALESKASRRIRCFPLGHSITITDWQRAAFADFGLYVFRYVELLVVFRCFSGLAPAAPRGHTHDDNLGIEYRLGSIERRDPGSFVYTPSVAQRNAYRAAAAHDVPRAAGWTIAPAGKDLFNLDHHAYATCLAWRPNGVAGEIRAPRGRILRVVRFTSTELVISDFIDPPQAFAPAADLSVATGYGRS